MRITVINGPNINMLEKREKEQYGSESFEKLQEDIVRAWQHHTFTFFQSNHEGELIDYIQKIVEEESADSLIVNFGGFTHTSVAIRDALEMIKMPKIEVHMSNIHARESFRHTSMTAGACNGVIAGFGSGSYHMAVSAVENLVT